MPQGPDPVSGAERPLAFQILIDDRPVDPENFSPALQLNLQSVRLAYPGHRHHLFQDEELRDLLARDFDRDVVAAYAALVPYAYRADLARYCVLHRFGGFYSDLSYLHLKALQLPVGASLALFHDHRPPNDDTVSNSILLSRPGDALLEKAIRQIVAHHREGYLGTSVLDPTGPNLLLRLMRQMPDAQMLIGHTRTITRRQSGRDEIAKVLNDGTLIAVRNKARDSSIADLIQGGGNDYGKLWQAGKVWSDRATPPPVTPRARPSLASRLRTWALRQSR